MQVSLLKLNAGISRAVTTASTLERQNADFEAQIARLSAGDRVRDAALAEDMVTPPPGAIEFLRARPDRDGSARRPPHGAAERRGGRDHGQPRARARRARRRAAGHDDRPGRRRHGAGRPGGHDDDDDADAGADPRAEPVAPAAAPGTGATAAPQG